MYIDIKDMLVWQKAHALTLEIYKVTTDFPKHELYGLTSQMRRSAASIPCNISEGKGRGSKNDYRRFLLIARGSMEELRYQCVLSRDLGYVEVSIYDQLEENLLEISRILNAMIIKLHEQ